MTRPEKIFHGTLPTVLEDVSYSDAKGEQCILAEKEYKNLYYGDVAARYQDPRPLVREFRDIESMSDKEIEKLNKELDSIEYSNTGKTRNTNVRRCKYIACSKDWYIAITENGQVEIQILKKDDRATKECKEKAESVIKEIKDDKLIIPTDFGNVGGDER